MISSKRYTNEFKSEEDKYVTERGHSVAERLGTIHTLYAWLKKYGEQSP